MPDYTPDFFTDERDPGYYKVTYGGDPAPAGPFEDVPAMAAALNLTDYPGDGYIVTWEPVTGELGSVPSLNPDDLRGACILTAENMATEDDCTTHDHEPATLGWGEYSAINRAHRIVEALDDLRPTTRLSQMDRDLTELRTEMRELVDCLFELRSNVDYLTTWHVIAPRRLANGHQRTSWTLTFDGEAWCWYWLERLDVLGDEGRWEDHGTTGSPLMDEYLHRCTPDDAEADLLDKLSVDDSAVALRQLAPFVARMLDLPGVEFRRDGDRFTIHPAAAVGA